MNTIIFHDTHVYAGCVATIEEMVVSKGSVAQGIAEFSDGSTAAATFEPLESKEILIQIEAYTTARGSKIGAKAWRLKYSNDIDLWKVLAKI